MALSTTPLQMQVVTFALVPSVLILLTNLFQNMKFTLLLTGLILLVFFSNAQLLESKEIFTKADTLRGSITRYRQGWDVVKYDLTVQPDISKKTITGKTTITYNETLPNHT